MPSTITISPDQLTQMAIAFDRVAAAADAMRELAEHFTGLSQEAYYTSASRFDSTASAPDPSPVMEQTAQPEPEPTPEKAREITVETLRPRFATASKAGHRDRLIAFLKEHSVTKLPDLDAAAFSAADQLLTELGA